MRMLETIQTVKVRIRQPAEPWLQIGPVSKQHIAQMRAAAMRGTKETAAAQGAEVLEYTIHSVEVVES